MFKSLNKAIPFIAREKITNIGTGANLDNPTKILSIDILDSDRRRGMMVVGATGVGKTRLEEHFVSQDIAKGYNVVVFDPKGDQALFSKIYELAIKYDRREDLILVTPLYPELSALINPMQEYFMIDEPVDHVT